MYVSYFYVVIYLISLVKLSCFYVGSYFIVKTIFNVIYVLIIQIIQAAVTSQHSLKCDNIGRLEVAPTLGNIVRICTNIGIKMFENWLRNCRWFIRKENTPRGPFQVLLSCQLSSPKECHFRWMKMESPRLYCVVDLITMHELYKFSFKFKRCGCAVTQTFGY